jgi:hypothetical protein
VVRLIAGEVTAIVKITHGLGGNKGLLILTVTVLVGLAAVLATWVFRQSIQAAPSTVDASPDEILRLGANARGQMPEIPYVAKDLARVASFAVAQRMDGDWAGLPAGTVLQVANTSVESKDLWVSGTVQGGTTKESIKIHSSFLARYLPVALGNAVELSDVRLMHMPENPAPRMMVSGWLRNVTSQTLSQCTVVCTFQDKGGAKLDRQAAPDMVLHPLEFIRFETAATRTEGQFAAITLEISHATPDGLRNYLPAVLIPHGSGQQTQ